MFKGMTHLHITSVMVFLIIYLIKTVLLLANANETLEKFKAKTKVLEMIVSTAFLGTGIYMLFNIPEIKPMLVIKIGIVFASIPIAIIAYRKNNKGLAVLSLVMIIASYGLAEMSKKHNGQPISLPGDAVNNLTDEEFAEKFGKDFYLPTLVEIIPTDNSNQKIVKIAFIGHNNETKENQLKSIYNLIANIQQDKVLFSRYLDYTTQNWKTETKESLTYKISPNKTINETEITKQQKDIDKIYNV
jgi:uncharacterized membrane protein SirB2